MKTIFKTTILLFVLTWALQNAYSQSEDSIKQNNGWKFVAGVTLYNNNYYGSDIKLLER